MDLQWKEAMFSIFPISFSQRNFWLIDENETGLTDENTYQITSDDLGDVMGIVGNSQDEVSLEKRFIISSSSRQMTPSAL